MAWLLLLALWPLASGLRTLPDGEDIDQDYVWQAEAWKESFEAEARDYAAHLPREAEFAASHAGQAALAKEVGHEDQGGNRTFFFIMSTSAETLSLMKQRVIESVFYHHPGARVRLYATLKAEVGAFNELLAPLQEKHDVRAVPFDIAEECLGRLKADPGFEQLQKQIERFEYNLPGYQETPLWPTQQTNLVRLFLLYYKGGVYLDTDALLVKPFPEGYRNVVGLQQERQANNAVMAFEKGNGFIRECLVEIITNFRPLVWGINGPQLITRIWHRRMRQRPEWELTVLPIPVFSPVFCRISEKVYWELPLDTKESLDAAKLIEEESVVVHFFFHSGHEHDDTETLGKVLMRKYCVLCDRDIFAARRRNNATS